MPYDKISLLDSPPHRALALEAAEQGIVLLQNKNKSKDKQSAVEVNHPESLVGPF